MNRSRRPGPGSDDDDPMLQAAREAFGDEIAKSKDEETRLRREARKALTEEPGDVIPGLAEETDETPRPGRPPANGFPKAGDLGGGDEFAEEEPMAAAGQPLAGGNHVGYRPGKPVEEGEEPEAGEAGEAEEKLKGSYQDLLDWLADTFGRTADHYSEPEPKQAEAPAEEYDYPFVSRRQPSPPSHSYWKDGPFGDRYDAVQPMPGERGFSHFQKKERAFFFWERVTEESISIPGYVPEWYWRAQQRRDFPVNDRVPEHERPDNWLSISREAQKKYAERYEALKGWWKANRHGRWPGMNNLRWHHFLFG